MYMYVLNYAAEKEGKKKEAKACVWIDGCADGCDEDDSVNATGWLGWLLYSRCTVGASHLQAEMESEAISGTTTADGEGRDTYSMY
jgi:hypothetical protein